MIEETGEVGEVRPGQALVQTQRGAGCERCRARGGCSHLGGGRDARGWVAGPLGVRVGDRVVVAVPEGTALRASVLVYLVPALCLMLGAFLGDRLAPVWGVPRDLGAAGLGLGGMVLAFLGVRLFGGRRIPGPTVVRRI